MSISSDDETPNMSVSYFPFCGPLHQLLENHPIRPALENYHTYRLSQLILKVLGEFEVTLFGGYLRRWIYSSNRIRSKTQDGEDVTNNAAKSLQDCKTFVRISKYNREDFVDGNCDMDIRLQDVKQIPIIMDALRKVGLQTIVKPRRSASRYGGGGNGIVLTSVKVKANDVLSGFRSQMCLDLVYIQHPELWTMDFGVNALEFQLGSEKKLCSNNMSIAERYIDKIPTSCSISSIDVDMKDELSVIMNRLSLMSLMSQIINRIACLNFQRLSDFYESANFEEIVLQQDIWEVKIAFHNGSIHVRFDESFVYPANILLFYANYLKILLFRRVAKMKVAGFRIVGIPETLVDMVLLFNAGDIRRIILQVQKNCIQFNYDGNIMCFTMNKLDYGIELSPQPASD